MNVSAVKSPKRERGRWVVVSALLVTAAFAMLALIVRSDAKLAERKLTPLEQEAAARFAGSEPYITLSDGRRIPPSNAAHALQMKVNALQGILAKESEQRDPTFHLKAEAELTRRRPMQAAIEWTDLSGNREMNFTIEDSSQCALDDKLEFNLAVQDVAHHPCLAQGGSFWEAGTQLKVRLILVSQEDRVWVELLHSTKKAMATEEHLASLDAAKGS